MTSTDPIADDPALAVVNWRETREYIHSEFDKATTSQQRGALLAMFKALMDAVERTMIDPQEVDKFRKARESDYCFFLVKECRDGDNINSELLDRATKREVEAGRMSPEHDLYKLAHAASRLGIGTTKQLREMEAWTTARRERRERIERLLPRWLKSWIMPNKTVNSQSPKG